MTRSVLADTGPLYALADPSDQFHHRAHQELTQLIREKGSVIVTYPILCQAYTLVLRRLGNAYALQWLAEISKSGTLINPDVADFHRASTALKLFSDQPITLVDAVLAQISERLQTPIWTYDRHFTTLRADVWPAN